MTPRCRLRYFFSPGSGVCLWPADDAARVRWGGAVDVATLDLAENTQRQAAYLIAWYDTSIDWDQPSAPSPWNVDEQARFDHAAQALLVSLRAQLGEDIGVDDASQTASQTAALP